MLSSVSFLIPAYNDHSTMREVIAETVSVGKRVAKKYEIVVIDDGSREPIRISFGRIIRHRVNQGYGRTIKELYYAGKNEWLFTIPGDYQVGAKELETMIRNFSLSSPRRRGSSLRKIDSRFRGNDKVEALPDMILGRRKKRNDPVSRLFVSWVYNTLLRLLFGITLHDVNSVRLMRRSVLKNISLTSTSAFVDAELVIRALRKGFHVIEVPISHRPRADDSGGGGNQWRTITATIIDMLRFLL